ncbi:MAG: hypothetical protein JKY54_07955 [Flavobacteriales bacterium]|nr:hypothetical protein [Flavobacteriales bacterium]
MDEFKIKVPKSQENFITVKKNDGQQSAHTDINSNKLKSKYNQGAVEVQLGCNQGAVEVEPPLENTKLTEPDNTHAQIKKIKNISGASRNILLKISEMIENNNMEDTGATSIKELSTMITSPLNTVKSSIFRLKKQGLITSKAHKTGPSGFVSFEIPESLKLEVKTLEASPRSVQSLGCNWGANKGATIDIVSKYVNTTTYKNNNTPVDWQDLDLSPLKSENFSESHLTQIYREYVDKPDLALPVQIIQNSIDEMAFDLKHNNAKAGFRSPPAVLLTSILKKGRPYSTKTPDKYISPQEEAMQNYHASQAIQQKRQQDLESQIVEAEYNTWKNNLSEEELLEFAPEVEFANAPEKIRKTMRRRKALELTKDYFLAEIWPEQKLKILNSSQNQNKNPSKTKSEGGDEEITQNTTKDTGEN